MSQMAGAGEVLLIRRGWGWGQARLSGEGWSSGWWETVQIRDEEEGSKLASLGTVRGCSACYRRASTDSDQGNTLGDGQGFQGGCRAPR